MDMLKTVREIGFFETGNNLVEVLRSADVQAKAGEVMPLPGKELIENTSRIADWLAAFGKHKYMLLTPEIHLIDCQTAHCGRGKPHFIFGGFTSPIVPYRNLPQAPDGMTANCHSLV